MTGIVGVPVHVLLSGQAAGPAFSRYLSRSLVQGISAVDVAWELVAVSEDRSEVYVEASVPLL